MERGQHAQSRKKRVQLNESFARLREAVIALGHDPDALGTQALIMRAALALLRDHIAVLLHVISPDDVNIALDHDRKRRGKKKDEGTNEPTSPEPLKPPSPAASMPTSGPDSKGKYFPKPTSEETASFPPYAPYDANSMGNVMEGSPRILHNPTVSSFPPISYEAGQSFFDELDQRSSFRKSTGSHLHGANSMPSMSASRPGATLDVSLDTNSNSSSPALPRAALVNSNDAGGLSGNGMVVGNGMTFMATGGLGGFYSPSMNDQRAFIPPSQVERLLSSSSASYDMEDKNLSTFFESGEASDEREIHDQLEVPMEHISLSTSPRLAPPSILTPPTRRAHYGQLSTMADQFLPQNPDPTRPNPSTNFNEFSNSKISTRPSHGSLHPSSHTFFSFAPPPPPLSHSEESSTHHSNSYSMSESAHHSYDVHISRPDGYGIFANSHGLPHPMNPHASSIAHTRPHDRFAKSDPIATTNSLPISLSQSLPSRIAARDSPRRKGNANSIPGANLTASPSGFPSVSPRDSRLAESHTSTSSSSTSSSSSASVNLPFPRAVKAEASIHFSKISENNDEFTTLNPSSFNNGIVKMEMESSNLPSSASSSSFSPSSSALHTATQGTSISNRDLTQFTHLSTPSSSPSFQAMNGRNGFLGGSSGAAAPPLDPTAKLSGKAKGARTPKFRHSPYQARMNSNSPPPLPWQQQAQQANASASPRRGQPNPTQNVVSDPDDDSDEDRMI